MKMHGRDNNLLLSSSMNIVSNYARKKEILNESAYEHYNKLLEDKLEIYKEKIKIIIFLVGIAIFVTIYKYYKRINNS